MAPPLRRSFRARVHLSVFQHSDFQPTADEVEDAWVPHAVLHKSPHPLVVQTPEEVLPVGFEDPAHAFPGNGFIEGRERMMGTDTRSITVGTPTLRRLSGLWYPHPPDGGWMIGFAGGRPPKVAEPMC